MASDVNPADVGSTTFTVNDLGPGPDQDRQEAILKHLEFAHYCARRQWRKVSKHHFGTFFDLDDLKSAATLGLIGAVDRFDPERGWKFATFAVARINGAILDALREIDPLTRVMRRYVKEVDRLKEKLGREPTRQELSKSMGVRVATIRKWEVETSTYSSMSLDEAIVDKTWRARDEGAEPVKLMRFMDSGDVVEDLVIERITASRELERMDERYREMVCAHLLGMTLSKIGERHGVTESRVCQIVAKFRRSVAA